MLATILALGAADSASVVWHDDWDVASDESHRRSRAILTLYDTSRELDPESSGFVHRAQEAMSAHASDFVLYREQHSGSSFGERLTKSGPRLERRPAVGLEMPSVGLSVVVYEEDRWFVISNLITLFQSLGALEEIERDRWCELVCRTLCEPKEPLREAPCRDLAKLHREVFLRMVLHTYRERSALGLQPSVDTFSRLCFDAVSVVPQEAASRLEPAYCRDLGSLVFEHALKRQAWPMCEWAITLFAKNDGRVVESKRLERMEQLLAEQRLPGG